MIPLNWTVETGHFMFLLIYGRKGKKGGGSRVDYDDLSLKIVLNYF